MSDYTDNFFSFIKEHINDNIHTLLLKKEKNCSFNYNLAVEQIESRQKLKNKLPYWSENYRLIFPSKLAYEQSSSQITAQYKQRLVKGSSVCDLTGGLGIDFFYLSQVVKQATYVEINENYCKAASHNFSELNIRNIQIINDNCEHYLNNSESDTYYIDPARRGNENKRLYALTDCEPNIIEIKDTILKKGNRLIIKASPMLDINASIQALETVSEVHVLSVKNECKELLFVLDRDTLPNNNTDIICVNFTSTAEQIYSFRLNDEKETVPHISDTLQHFLYEPNASIMKAGAFKSVSLNYDIQKLHINSHLYTSDKKIESFPGRVFEIKECFDFSKKTLLSITSKYPAANLSTRNFPISTELLRTKMKIKEGGNVYIFATTLYPDKKVIIICTKSEMD